MLGSQRENNRASDPYTLEVSDASLSKREAGRVLERGSSSETGEGGIIFF